MNWDALGAGAELVAAVGVILSLVYLARQIRQSNATDQLTATLSLQSSYNEVGDLFLRDADIVAKGLVDLDDLDPAGQLKFLVIFHLFFGHVELVHSHERKGMLDPDLLNRTYTSLYAYYRLPGVKQWWDRMGRGQFSPEFVVFVEDPDEGGLHNVPMVPTE
jgi:hypothetical protein